MTHYEVLQISMTATDGEIRAAYLKRARVVHPDMGGTHEDFLALQEAYDTLSNPFRRTLYNLEIVMAQATPRQDASHRWRAKQKASQQKPRTFEMRFNTYTVTRGFSSRKYIEPEGLIDSLNRAAVFYKGAEASEILQLINDAIKRMMK